MSDSISRLDAIQWVKTECNPYGKPTLEFESGKRVIEHLKQMPSAEPKTGEWIDKRNWMGFECSRCKCHSRYVTPFCSQCGARMYREDGEV